MEKKIVTGFLSVGMFWSLLAGGAPAPVSSEPVRTTEGAAIRDEALRPVEVSFGTGPAIHRSSTGWSLAAELLARPVKDESFYVGAELGLGLWSFSSAVSPASSGATSVSLLPSAVYRFKSVDRSVTPYMGLALGPALYFESVRRAGGDTTDTRVFFELLFRPGVQFSLTRSLDLSVEAKLGVLGGDFLFLPQAALSFPI